MNANKIGIQWYNKSVVCNVYCNCAIDVGVADDHRDTLNGYSIHSWILRSTAVYGDHSNAVQTASTVVTLERKANLKERNHYIQ